MSDDKKNSFGNYNSFSPISTKLYDAFLNNISLITFSELTSIINSMSSSTCSLDLIPTHYYKELSFFFYQIIFELINLFLTEAIFLFYLRIFLIFIILKKYILFIEANGGNDKKHCEQSEIKIQIDKN